MDATQDRSFHTTTFPQYHGPLPFRDNHIYARKRRDQAIVILQASINKLDADRFDARYFEIVRFSACVSNHEQNLVSQRWD